MYSWKYTVCLLVLIPALSIGHGLPCSTHLPEPDHESIVCEPTHSKLCKDLGFSATSFPNILNHTNQLQAMRFLLSVYSNYSVGSSRYLVHFLCATTFPVCAPRLFRRIGPCREMCTAVRESCRPIVESLGLDCNRFEQFATSRVPCIWNSSECNMGILDDVNNMDGASDGTPRGKRRQTNCTGHLTPLSSTTKPSRATSFGGVEHCTEPCHGAFFDQGEQNLIVVWITAWSLVTLFVSAVMFLTYMLNFKKIPSLEAPIYYIALCYALSALGYTLSVAIGSTSLICNSEFTNEFNVSALVVDGLHSPLCVAVFGLLYYFTLCTWSWWTVLCIQWSLCTLKFANIGNSWKLCFHIVAWGLPLLLLVFAISLNHVSGDPIMHTCWIKKQQELPYLIVPLLTFLVLCSIIVVICFARVVKLQNYPKHKSNEQVNRIEHQTLVRVGLYCTVYLLPMGVLLCVYFYEFWFRDQWEVDYLQCSVLGSGNCVNKTSPLLPLFLAKITSSLLMGIVSLFWIIKSSTAIAWRKACCFYLATSHADSGSYAPNMNAQQQCHNCSSQNGHYSTHNVSYTFNSESPL